MLARSRACHSRALPLDLPPVVCVRLTRRCNARCGYCLAPPDGTPHPAAATLVHRLDWLLARGVRTVHFCGGEPTLHPALPRLIERVHTAGATTRLTTNGIALAEDLVPVLRAAGCRVKVSIYGDRDHHDAMVGVQAFDRTVANLRRLLAADVAASVQTTVVAGGEWAVDRVAALCLDLGVRRLSILPFLPRGRGAGRCGDYALTSAQRRELRDLVRRKRRELHGRLDVRWLDFTARPFHVVDADGRVVLEGATESMDEVLCEIPAEA